MQITDSSVHLSFIVSPISINIITKSAGYKLTSYPHVPSVNDRCKELIVLYSLLLGRIGDDGQVSVHDYVRQLDWTELAAKKLSTGTGTGTGTGTAAAVDRVAVDVHRRHVSAVLKMTQMGWTVDDVNSLPAGVALPLKHALYLCQLHPATDWPDQTYRLINRRDMAKDALVVASGALFSPELNARASDGLHLGGPAASSSREDGADDGMEDVIQSPLLKLLFAKDHRVHEVRRLLCSSRPVTVALPAAQQQGLSEHELIEEREKQLLVTCIRVMALPVGRGMFSLHTSDPTVTQTLSVPRCPLLKSLQLFPNVTILTFIV